MTRAGRRTLPPALWPLLELGSIVVAQLVLTPLLLHRLSTPQFGAWVIAQSLLLGSALLSLGTGQALLPLLARATGDVDRAAGWTAIVRFRRRCMRLSLAAAAAAALLPPLAPWTGANVVAIGGVELALLGAATLAWVGATEFDLGLSAALKATSHFAAVALIELGSRVLQLVAIAGLIDAGASALWPIALSVAATSIKWPLKWRLLRRVWAPAPARIAAAAVDVADAAAFDAAGRWVLLGIASGLAFYAFDRWYVGAAFGSAVLAGYAVCAQVAQLPHAVATAAAQTLVPWAARCRRRVPDPRVARLARRRMIVATAWCALPALVLLPLLEPLLARWISPAFAAEHLALAQALTVVSLLMALNVPISQLLFGLGHFRGPTLYVLTLCTLFVVGCLMVVPGLWAFVGWRAAVAVGWLGLVAVFWHALAPHSR